MPVCRWCNAEFEIKDKYSGARRFCYKPECKKKNDEHRIMLSRTTAREARQRHYTKIQIEEKTSSIRKCQKCHKKLKDGYMFYCKSCQPGEDWIEETGVYY